MKSCDLEPSPPAALGAQTHLRHARQEGLDVNVGVVHLQVMIS